jgi:hypothetical protein
MFTNEQLHDILHLQLKLNGRVHKDNFSIAMAMSKATHAIWVEKKLIADKLDL